jgi:NO-binding membrane sensor protein with MHYT domain
MAHSDHFAMGYWTLFLAFAVSVVGCGLGLASLGRARLAPPGRPRLWWVSLGAVAIGWVGIWLMHFIAMLGYSPGGTEIMLNLPLTVLSAVIAIVVVGLGLISLGPVPKVTWRLPVAGVFTGIGVAAMHYTGTAAIRVAGQIGYDPATVAVSVLISVVAATAAFWFIIVVRRAVGLLLASVVMAMAVTAMHYTGMMAMRYEAVPGGPAVTGMDTFSLVFPVFVVAAVVMAVLMSALLVGMDNTSQPVGQPVSR